MLTLLSPAKTLDFETKPVTKKHSEPRLVREAAQLIDVLRTKSPAELSQLMGISEDLATLNFQRYVDFTIAHSTGNARQAILAFHGDVYRGLAATEFEARDFTEAQKTLRILSGLYGVLRPLDLIQPYRLEMGTKLATSRGKSLYEWWGTKITDQLKRDVDASPGADVVINLASSEYFGAVVTDRLGIKVITPRFEDRDSKGNSRVLSFFAKRARGLMAAWLIQTRARTASKLWEFNAAGYEFDESRSTKEQPVFVR